MTASFEEQLALIRELQQIDLNLHNFQLVLNALPERLETVVATYSAVKGELDAARAELSDVEKAKRTDEGELAAAVDHFRNREAKLYAIKTNKEYQAALKEISEGKRQNREREDRILQAMERIEGLMQKITQLEQDCADKETALKAVQEAVAKEDQEIREHMRGDAERRPGVVDLIDKALVRKYDFVRQRYAQAVADVSEGICQGCSRRIPPQLFNEMLRRVELKSCPSCQRLIYVQEAKGEKPEEAGAAG